MKLNSSPSGSARRGCLAFTLVEMMFSVVIYTFVFIGALVAVQVYALRVYTLGATKITATQGARKALNQIRDDIRQAKLAQVGNADNNGNFTAVTGSGLAIGNALEIFFTTNQAAPYSLYYLQTNNVAGTSSNNLLWVWANTNVAAVTQKLATYITNLDVFEAEGWDNWPTNTTTPPVITNCLQNNQVYSVKMQFYQWEYPIAVISTNSAANAYDYYQVRTRVCRRALD